MQPMTHDEDLEAIIAYASMLCGVCGNAEDEEAARGMRRVLNLIIDHAIAARKRHLTRD
jgi:hypothetical protein